MLNQQVKVLRAAFQYLQDENDYCNKWIMQEVLLEVLEFHELNPYSMLSAKSFTRTVNKAYPLISLNDIKNPTGFVRKDIQKGGGIKKYVFYFRPKGTDCSVPPKDIGNYYNSAFKTLDSLHATCAPSITTPRSQEERPDFSFIQPPNPKRQKRSSQREPGVFSFLQHNSAFKRLESLHTSCAPSTCSQTQSRPNFSFIQPSLTPNPKMQETSSPLLQHDSNISQSKILERQSKWDDSEATLYFIGQKRYAEQKAQKSVGNEVNFDLKLHIKQQIKKLKTAYLRSDGWRQIVDDGDPFDKCTEYDIFAIRKKSRYLVVALTYMLQKYLLYSKVADIYRLAMEKVNEFDSIGDQYSKEDGEELVVSSLDIQNERTIMTWFCIYRDNDDCFPNPSTVRCGRKKVPL